MHDHGPHLGSPRKRWPPPSRARIDGAGDQVIEITVDHGYWPRSIVARADSPLRLVFHRQDDDSCLERVVFSSPHLERHLAPSADTTIVLPAQPAGEIRFTCAMGRYHGRIELRPDPRPSLLERLRAAATRQDSPFGLAIVLWICSLPLIAVLAVLALDPTAAVAAALLALVAWILGCVWAFGESRRAA